MRLLTVDLLLYRDDRDLVHHGEFAVMLGGHSVPFELLILCHQACDHPWLQAHLQHHVCHKTYAQQNEKNHNCQQSN